jgi:hypothetical protein
MMMPRIFTVLIAVGGVGLFVAGLAFGIAKAGNALPRELNVTVIEFAELRAACGAGKPEAGAGRVASGKTSRVIR